MKSTAAMLLRGLKHKLSAGMRDNSFIGRAGGKAEGAGNV
jgi:hypothetical protein